jgi:hypothetical protein
VPDEIMPVSTEDGWAGDADMVYSPSEIVDIAAPQHDFRLALSAVKRLSQLRP